MVVPVFMKSCHVSEKPKMGPESAQAAIMIRAARKDIGLPAIFDTFRASLRKVSFMSIYKHSIWLKACLAISKLVRTQSARRVG